MSRGASLHRRAQRLSQRMGAPITFTHTEQEYDPTTGNTAPAETSITGNAVPDDQDQSQLYQALGLVVAKAITLLFTPATYGQKPELGDTCVYAGETRTVRHVAPVELDGNAIMSKVTVSS
jgi:hypothetical protein